MDEKILIESEKGDIKKIRNILFYVGIAFFGVFLLLELDYFAYLLRGEYISKYGIDDFIFELITGVLVFAGPPILIGFLFYYFVSKVKLTVTDKRVFGRTAFGKRVDLPLDSVTAIGIGFLNSIAITTASGAIKFAMVKNKNEIHQTMSKLLINRQSKSSVTESKTTNNSDYTEELKKIKDLLEAGVITQEEFEAKKKQLLGL